MRDVILFIMACSLLALVYQSQIKEKDSNNFCAGPNSILRCKKGDVIYTGSPAKYCDLYKPVISRIISYDNETDTYFICIYRGAERQRK